MFTRVKIFHSWLCRAQLGEQHNITEGSQHIALQGSLQAYANYVQTERFARAMVQLEQLAKSAGTAVMTESLAPENSHRSLIADYLLLHGHEVLHILNDTEAQLHQLSSLARRESAALVYDQKGHA